MSGIELIYHFRKDTSARTGKPGTCLWCGSALKPAQFAKPDSRPGAYQDGAFCTMRCGYMFGVIAARDGVRMKTP